MIYLHPKQVIYLAEKVVEQSGGSPGLRDQGLLESAVYRPQATFGGQDLYPDLFTKTAALGFSIIKNHPFIDGNKRIGFEAMRLMLRLNGMDIKASQDEKFKFVMGLAEGKMTEQAVSEWLRQRAKPYSPSR